nr:RNA-directed DNA polymerase, eukaryota, reverse transcriptase zinc-binding domain protein [Tanacetum cinerariifolium]
MENLFFLVISTRSLTNTKGQMNKAGSKLSKLDRFLISEGVMEDILDIKVTAIERLWSDHSHIRLHSKKADFGPSPFKLYNSWLSKDGFDDIVKSTWDSMETSNESSHQMRYRGRRHGIINSKRRTQAIADFLESHISFIEVKNAVWECGGNKAPGPDGANFSFFTLSPKISNPLSVEDFRPISLIGTHYKIISKLLANRLSKVIDKVVSKEQFAFISGRQILDGPLIISEIIQWYKKRKKKMLIFKVDFEKAFDSVSWKHLDFILDNLGFVSKWRSWIRACLHSSRAFILINGSPTSEFSIKRGLRTGCAAGCFPFTYLGLPIGANMNLTSIWQILIDRFQKRFSSWKANLLSLGGRLTLIKAVLGSLGIYYLSIFKAPETILNSMESLRSKFFWGGSQDSRNMAWVKWSQVLPSFEKRGLQIDSLKAFNLALLQKWRWRLLSSSNNMWVNIIKALHGKEGGLNNQGCSFNGTWSRIIGTSNFHHSKGIVPLNSFCFKVGCGTRVRFWKD